MPRFLLTAILVAALGTVAGIWLDGSWREMRRRAEAQFEVTLERELERPISLTEISGPDLTLEEALLHIARQVHIPVAVNRSRLDEVVFRKKQVWLPQGELSLRNVLGILYRQVSIGYFRDQSRLIITSSADADRKLITRVYPLPPAGIPQSPREGDSLQWDGLLPIVAESNAWPERGGEGTVLRLPGALLVRQSRRVHENLARLFRQIDMQPQVPDALADYLAAFTPGEQRIQAVLDTPGDFQYTSAPLCEVIDDLSWKYRVPIVLDQPGLAERRILVTTRVTIVMKGVSLSSFLSALLDPLELTQVIRDDAVFVTNLILEKSDFGNPHVDESRPVLFDVRDLAARRSDLDQLVAMTASMVPPDRIGKVGSFNGLPGRLISFAEDHVQRKRADFLAELRSQLTPRSPSADARQSRSPAGQKIATMLARNIDLNYQRVILKDVVADIVERTGINIRFDESVLLQDDITVSCSLPPLPLREALRQMLGKEIYGGDRLYCYVEGDCLVVSRRRSPPREVRVADVSSLVGPEYRECFTEECLSDLLERSVELPQAHNPEVSIFRSRLIVSAPEEVNERVLAIVEGLTRYHRESQACRQQGRIPVDSVQIELPGSRPDGPQFRIFPVEDLLGSSRSVSFEDLQAALATVYSGRLPELMAPIPPGGLLVSQTPEGHLECQHFLDELRQHLVPGHQKPDWMTKRDQKREELDLELSSRQTVLEGVTNWMELEAALEQALDRDVELDKVFVQIGWRELSPSRGDVPPEPADTIRQQLAGIGVTVALEKNDAWKLTALEDDIRLRFYNVKDLLSGTHRFTPAELNAVFDAGQNRFLPTWMQDGDDEPVCYRDWLIVRGHPERLLFLERLLAWLRQHPSVIHATAVFERADPGESTELLHQLLVSTSPDEQYYLAFLLQVTAPPESGLEKLAARVELLGEDRNSLMEIRLREVLQRWVTALPQESREQIVRASPSRLLRSAAIQALVSPVQQGLNETFGAQTIRRLLDQLKLAPEDIKEMELTLAGLRVQTIHRTKFDYELLHEAVAHAVESEDEAEPPLQNRTLPWRLLPERYRIK